MCANDNAKYFVMRIIKEWKTEKRWKKKIIQCEKKSLESVYKNFNYDIPTWKKWIQDNKNTIISITTTKKKKEKNVLYIKIKHTKCKKKKNLSNKQLTKTNYTNNYSQAN